MGHQETSCDRQQTSQVHLTRVNQSAYGAKPRGGEAWHGPRAQISKILLSREPGGHFYLVHDIHGERVSPVAIVDRDEGQALPGRRQRCHEAALRPLCVLDLLHVEPLAGTGAGTTQEGKSLHSSSSEGGGQSQDLPVPALLRPFLLCQEPQIPSHQGLLSPMWCLAPSVFSQESPEPGHSQLRAQLATPT